MKVYLFLKNWFAFILLFCVVYYLSSQKGGTFPLLPFTNGDKAVHMGIYYLLGLALSYGLYHQSRWLRLHYRWLILCICLAPFLALFDEWHQSWVVGRFVDVWDGVSDVAGMILAALTNELSRLTTHKKRFLPLPQMRKNIIWYRLNFLWLFFLALGWQVYFLNHDLNDSTLTQSFSEIVFMNLWHGGVASVMGLMWCRYILFEMWWQNQAENNKVLAQGFFLGLILTLGACAFTIQTLSSAALAYTTFFGIYSLGLKFLKNQPQDSKVSMLSQSWN